MPIDCIKEHMNNFILRKPECQVVVFTFQVATTRGELDRVGAGKQVACLVGVIKKQSLSSLYKCECNFVKLTARLGVIFKFYV